MRLLARPQGVTDVTQRVCMKWVVAGYDRFIITPTVRNGRGDEPWSTFLSRLGPGLVRVRGPVGDRWALAVEDQPKRRWSPAAWSHG